MKKYIPNIIALISIVGIFIWLHYLIKNDYIVECFTEKTVTERMPINTRYTCQNMCGPMARCRVTGEQCQKDSDCVGCKPVFLNPEEIKQTADVEGYNDAGKLGQRGLLYSTLTTDPIAREAGLYTKNQHLPPPKVLFGKNTWRNNFDEGMKYFEMTHGSYSTTYPSLTGEFNDIGPLAANE